MKDLNLTPEVAGVLGEVAFDLMPVIDQMRRNGKRVVGLQVGEPGIPTFPHIIEAAKAALDRGETHYTAPGGSAPMRESVANYVVNRTGVPTERENVVVTPGSKLIIEFALKSLVHRGAEVLIPDPGYSAYSSLVNYVGGVPVSVPIREGNGFSLDPTQLESLVTDKTSMIIISSPANPTGGVISHEDLVAIADFAKKHDLWVLSDEIYSRLIFEGSHTTIRSLPDMAERTIVTDGTSKMLAMCGWRLGWGIMREDLAAAMVKLSGMTHSCPPSFVQSGAIAALESPETDVQIAQMLDGLRANRDVALAGLNAIPGVSCATPTAAFYAFANISKTGWSDDVFARQLLERSGVALLPGWAFGGHGEGYVRVSFAGALPDIEEGLEGMNNFVRRYHQHETPHSRTDPHLGLKALLGRMDPAPQRGPVQTGGTAFTQVPTAALPRTGSTLGGGSGLH